MGQGLCLLHVPAYDQRKNVVRNLWGNRGYLVTLHFKGNWPINFSKKNKYNEFGLTRQYSMLKVIEIIY